MHTTSNLSLLAILLALGASSCRRLVPSPSGSSSSASPEPTFQPTALPTPVPPPAPAPIAPLSDGAHTEDERNTIEVFRQAAPSVVFVTQTRVVVDYLGGTAQEVPAGSGSGFVWDESGNVVTNYHVVESARSLTVTFNNQQTFEARVVGVEPRKDIAVISVNAPKNLLRPVQLLKKTELEVGQKAIAIGNPFGLDHTLTTGVISALGRQVQGIGGVTIRDMVQTDAAINPGNSGGPLLDSGGRLIGMNTIIYSKSGTSAGIGFAVPASSIQRVVPQIIKNGRAEQLGLGVQVDPSRRLERRFGIHGVVVLDVVAGSPAARAGLRGITQTLSGLSLGDVIVAVDDHKVDDFDDLYNTLDQHHPGDMVEVKVRRGDQIVGIKTEVIALP